MKVAIAKQQPVNKFRRQPKVAPASTMGRRSKAARLKRHSKMKDFFFEAVFSVRSAPKIMELVV
jgi:hypothetical protein